MNPIEKTIIDQANLLCTNAFMDFPDYDPENPFTNLADALTVIIWDSLQLDCDSAVIYDFLNERLKEPETQETENSAKIQEAKAFLQENGYYTDNLWCVDDVKTRFECSDEEAQRVLHDALKNDATMEQINFSIGWHGEELGLEKIDENDEN